MCALNTKNWYCSEFEKRFDSFLCYTDEVSQLFPIQGYISYVRENYLSGLIYFINLHCIQIKSQRARRITVIVVSPGFSISVVSGCLLKGSVSEFNKWRVMTALSIILPLVGRMTGSRMSVIISGSITNKRNIYNYKPCCKVALLEREDEGFCFSYSRSKKGR